MGHQLIGLPPTTRKWKEVVSLVHFGANTRQIAQAVIHAMKGFFAKSFKDQGLREATFLLVNLPIAAKSENYLGELKKLGLKFDQAPTLFELIAACNSSLDHTFANTKGRTDLGEMAQAALGEALVSVLSPKLDNLFESDSDNVRRELANFDLRKGFGDLGREFYSRVAYKGLGGALERQTPNTTGPDKRFTTLEMHSHFQDGLRDHCWEMAKVLPKFVTDWVSSKRYEHGEITRKRAAELTYGAMEKLIKAIEAGDRTHAA